MPTGTEIVGFLWAVASHWGQLMTGGIIIALWGAYERWKKRTITWRRYLSVAAVFFLISVFLAWRDDHIKVELLNAEKNLQLKKQASLEVALQEKEKTIDQLQVALTTKTARPTQTQFPECSNPLQFSTAEFTPPASPQRQYGARVLIQKTATQMFRFRIHATTQIWNVKVRPALESQYAFLEVGQVVEIYFPSGITNAAIEVTMTGLEAVRVKCVDRVN